MLNTKISQKLIEHLRTDVDLKWGWLGGEPAEVVARSEKKQDFISQNMILER